MINYAVILQYMSIKQGLASSEIHCQFWIMYRHGGMASWNDM